MNSRLTKLRGAAMIIAWLLAVAPAKGVEISAVVDPVCFEGNSPAGCWLIPRTPVIGDFVAGDPSLDFRFVLADRQFIHWNPEQVWSGFEFWFSLDPPPDSELGMLTIADFAVQDDDGKLLASTGPVEEFEWPIEWGMEHESICSPGIASVGCSNDLYGSYLFNDFFNDVIFRQVVISLALAEPISVGESLSVTFSVNQHVAVLSGFEPTVGVLIAEPSLWSLVLLGIVSMGIRCSRRRTIAECPV